MSTQMFLDFKQAIISNHNEILNNLELKYSHRISELLIQKRLIAQQLQTTFMQQLDNINQLINNSQHKQPLTEDIIPPNIIIQHQQYNDEMTEDEHEPIINNQNHIEHVRVMNINHNHTVPHLEQYTFSDDNSDHENNSQPKMQIKTEIDRKYNFNNYNIHNGTNINQYSFIKCEQCNYKTDSKTRMEIHSRIHLKDKPFKCNVCFKSYTTRGALAVHKRIHSGILPFKCKVCNKSFNQIPHLRYHLLSHTNEKPWKCKNCNQSFKMKQLLKNHIKRV
eukprot:227804_1